MKIGIDLTYIPRFKDKEKFAKKVLSSNEFVEYQNNPNKEQYLASRFALKEAFVKAFEKSIFNSNLNEIETKHKDSGAIFIVYKSKQFNCSLSHENEYCIGVVLND